MKVNGSSSNSHKRSTDYTKIRKNYSHLFYQKVIPDLGDRKLNKHLDLATGTGVVVYDLADYFSESIGIDFSPERIAEAKKNLVQKKASIQFEIGTADSLSFSNATFDLITVAQAFQYFPQPQSILEIKRLLSPKGKFLIFWKYPDPDSALSKLANEGIEKTNVKFNKKLMLRKSMKERFDQQNIPDLIKKNGLKLKNSGILSYPYDYTKQEWKNSVSWAVGAGDDSLSESEIQLLENELENNLSKNNFHDSFQENFDHFFWQGSLKDF